MKTVSFLIWTHVTVSISYNDNPYTTGTSWVLIINQISLKIIFIWVMYFPKKKQKKKKKTLECLILKAYQPILHRYDATQGQFLIQGFFF